MWGLTVLFVFKGGEDGTAGAQGNEQIELNKIANVLTIEIHVHFQKLRDALESFTQRNGNADGFKLIHQGDCQTIILYLRKFCQS